MNNNLMDFMDIFDQAEINKFTAKTKSKMSVATNAKSIECDFSWLEKIEECIPFLDNIIRNPRKFIVQEEEVVPVEKAKKITQETVKHLAQHTNLIQDIDEDGNITPISVLNVHKEETFDLYENRFINSLLQNLYGFVKEKISGSPDGSFSKCERKISFEAETKLQYEKIKISLDMETSYFEDLVAADPSGLSLSARMERVSMIISDFMKAPFIRELSGALPVRSPIRKTNVILKENNFKKALELWEFIEKYRNVEPKISNEDSVINDDKTLKTQFDTTYYMNYAIINALNLKGKQKDNENFNKVYISKLIEDFVSDSTMDEKAFKKMILSKFKEAHLKKKNRHKCILNIFERSIDNYNKQIHDAIRILK